MVSLFSNMSTLNLPINVSNVEDLTVITADDRITAHELNVDRGPSEVATHGEVRDRGDHSDAGGDVVEDTLRARLGESKTNECERRAYHHGRHRPIPVGPMSGNGDFDMHTVDGVP